MKKIVSKPNAKGAVATPEKVAATPSLTFAAVEEMSGADLFKLAQDNIVKVAKSIETTTEKLGEVKDRLVGNMHQSAKIVASMKRRHQKAIYEREIPADTSFNGKKKRSYFAQHAGGFCPPRIEAMAAFFNATVLTVDAQGKPLLTEENFDAANVSWLEKANAVLSFEMDEHADWKTTDNTLDALNALSHPGDAMEKLKAIQAKQKGGDDETAADAAPLTLGVAVEFIKSLFADAGNQGKDRQIELCAAVFELNDAWAQNDLSDHRRAELDKQVMEAQEAGIAPGIQITRGEPVAA